MSGLVIVVILFAVAIVMLAIGKRRLGADALLMMRSGTRIGHQVDAVLRHSIG